MAASKRKTTTARRKTASASKKRAAPNTTTVEEEAKRPQAEHLPPHERVKLGVEIAGMRKGARPMTWTQIAKKLGRSERSCRGIYRHREQEIATLEEPLKIVEESLLLYAEGIERLSQLAVEAGNDSAKVGAVRAMLETTKLRLELLAATGMLPRSMAAYREHRDVERILGNVAKVLERADVEPGLLMKIVAVLDGQEPDDLLMIEGVAVEES